jgi:crotonobetainyl-CoA:carnitine CoA-transferase CaiB-like acyl-CoA transferase
VNDSRSGGPLAGVRVLELGTMYAAPTCGRMLRDFGADVIKVEDPGTGDYARQWTPMKNGQSFGFARLNSGKRWWRSTCAATPTVRRSAG